MAGSIEDRIRQRAHVIWRREGCPEGQAEQHWQHAEHEIANEIEAERRAAAKQKVTHAGSGAPQAAGRKRTARTKGAGPAEATVTGPKRRPAKRPQE